MKLILQLIIFFLLLTACTQKNNSLSASPKSEQTMDTLIIDTTANHKPIRTDERIDVDEFKAEIRKYGDQQKLNDGTVIERNYSYHPIVRSYNQFNILPTGYTYFKAYHPNGVLKTSLNIFRKTYFGIYSEYDSLGYLVKRIDYDKGYISIDKMVEKFKAQTKMDLYTEANMPKPLCDLSVVKVDVNDSSYYQITIESGICVPNRTKTPERIVYFLEGSTGNIVCERRVASKEIIEKIIAPGEKPDEGPSDVDLFKVYLDSIAAQEIKQKKKTRFGF